MNDEILISKEEYANLNDRVNKLATEKSYLQVFIHLMNEMSTVSGLENTIQNLLQIILGNIGGSNLIIYYIIDEEIFYADVFGEKKKIDQIDDDIIKKVFNTKEPIELKSDFTDTKLLGTEFTKASTWAFPLLVGTDLIGIFKIEGLYTGTADLHFHLPTFFGYAAHILKNEILGHTKLKKAFDLLTEENNLRKQADEELQIINEELEKRVEERTLELHQLNIQLEEELAERQRAEEQLAAQYTLLTALINSSNDIIIFSLDTNYCYTTFNEQHREEMKKVWNVDIEIGMNLLECIQIPELRVAAKQSINRALKGETFSEEQHQPEPDIYYEFSWNPIFQNEEIVGITAFIRNITERKRIEVGLQESEERFSIAFNDSPNSIAITHFPDGRILDVNKGFSQMFGYSREESIGKFTVDLALWNNNTVRETFFTKLKESGNVVDFETRLRRKDGSLFIAIMGARFIKLRGETCILSVTHDISERKKAEEDLRISQLIIESILNTIPARVFWKDKNLKFLGCNQVFANDAGFTDQKDIIGKDDSQMTWADQAELYRSDDMQVINSGCPKLNIEEPQTTPEGNTITLLTSKIPLRNSDGEISGVLGTYIDITERKKLEEALSKREREYRSLAENSPDNIIRYDRQCRAMYCNPKMIRTLDLDFEFLFNKTPIELGAGGPELSTEYQRHIKRVLETGDSSELEMVMPHPGGGFRNHLVRFVAERNTEGAIIGVLAIGQDITDRKRTEESLRESEMKLRVIFENSRDAIGVSKKGVHVFANPAYLKLFGYENLEKLIGTSILDCIAPSHHQQIIENLKRRDAGEDTPTFYETRGRRIDGSEFDFEINVSTYELNNEIYTLANIRDITDRKKTELQLINSEREYRTLAENIPNNIIRYDLDCRAVYINHMLETIKYSKSSIIGEPPSEKQFDGAKGIDDYNQKLRRVIKTGKEEEMEIVIPDLQGNIHVHEVHFVAERNTNGEITGALALGHDITERKMVEEEIQKLNADLEKRVAERTAQLENANKELETFAYSVSHDLRAPLRGIDGFSQALIDEYYEMFDEHGKNYLQRVRLSAQRMAQLIDDLLNLSRVSSGEINVQKVNLSKVASEIADDFHETQPERKVEFMIHEGINVQGDGRLLRIVLENLIGNAWKFTSKKPVGHIEFGMQKQEDKTVYFIRDNGAGFDMNYSQKLFGAFQRLHSASDFSGTGIGLATVQRIIHRHGGSVWAEAKVEKGATFYFTI